mmetsp:Transcript_27403/g.33428  ORF Transcript_27403/g.33428 Transcript_27403/m.33428 type:complete len:88 (-) Transcript_27403:35-298(-)
MVINQVIIEDSQKIKNSHLDIIPNEEPILLIDSHATHINLCIYITFMCIYLMVSKDTVYYLLWFYLYVLLMIACIICVYIQFSSAKE